MDTERRRFILSYIRGEQTGEQRIGFLHKDFARTRQQVSREWLSITMILVVAILAILSIFWGVFFNQDQRLQHLKIFVVNLDNEDTGIIGTHVVRLAQKLSQGSEPEAGWEIIPSDYFNGDFLKVRRAIYNFEAWAAITILPNASEHLQQAIAIGNSSYDPSRAGEIVYVGARDTYAIPNHIVPALNSFEILASREVGQAWANYILLNTSLQMNDFSAVPQALNPAIGFATIDLRPLGPTQVIPAVTVGALYLIVISFFSYAFFLPTHTHFINNMEGHRRLYFHQLVVWKYLSAVMAYLFLSLSYSLVSLAFGIPFSNPSASPVETAVNPNAYGLGSFVIFWMVNWLGMISLGLASENVAMLLGQPWSALWLVFWIISNVCTAFYPIELAPRFYYYGYAFPLHNIIEATKCILFDLHSRIGLNIGILLAWWAVNTALFPLCATFFRYKYLSALQIKKAEASVSGR